MDSQLYGQQLENAIIQASFDGRLKSDNGTLSITGDLCTLTAAAGKDLYLSAAKCIINWDETSGGAFVNNAIVALKANAVTKELAANAGTIGGSAAGTGSDSAIGEYEFKNLWQKVGPAEILKLEVTSLNIRFNARGFIQAIEVPTGENPLTYRGA